MTIIEGSVVPPKAADDDIVVHQPQVVFNEPNSSDRDTPAEKVGAHPVQGVDDETPPTTVEDAAGTDALGAVPQLVEGQEPVETPDDEEFDPLKALVSLLVGGAIEGTSQLVTRLQAYEEEFEQSKKNQDQAQTDDNTPIDDELVLLRYALVGFIFDTQARVRRSLPLFARLMNTSVNISGQAARPLTNSRLFSPIRRRYDGFVQRGESSMQKWVALGRKNEPKSRDLAKITYNEIIDEFIEHLAENPEIQTLVQQQSLGLAAEMRDEVRGRGVTADTMLENLVRRVLRRAPREELPEPPPEVQRWAGVTMEDFRATQLEIESRSSQSSPANEPND